MLRIYQSSAGSGKTYTLAREYIKFALRSPDYFKHILAVTFTNKAAEEMKTRVIEFLKAISKNKHELVVFYANELNISEELVAEKAGATLTAILHQYDEFNISTIDSFFHKVVRSFAREIGLQGSFQIEMDTGKVIEQITDYLFDEVEKNSQLKEWLVSFAMERLGNQKSYDFRDEVKGLAYQLFSEDFKKLPTSQFYEDDFKTKLTGFQKTLGNITHTFEKDVAAFASSFFKLLEETHLDGTELKGGKRSPIVSFFTKLENKNFKDLINKTIAGCLENAEAWTTKTSKRKDEIIQLAEARLMPLLQETIDYYEKNKAAYLTAQQVQSYLYTIGLLSDLSNRLKRYRSEEEAVLLSDLPDFLMQIIGDSDTPFIYEKVGSRYHHYLIDEFQDTSYFQWNNFRPLIEESLSNGYESLIVGDAKQSIYKFRGGDPSLLSYQVQKDIPHAEVLKLDTNYRSAATVVAFNNALFSALPAVIEDVSGAQLGEKGCEKLTNAYADVAQTPHKKEDEGQVEVTFIQAEKGEKWEDLAIEQTIALVEDIQKKGYKPSDIAFLVRERREAVLLAEAFISHKNKTNGEAVYDVITAEGLLLKNSPAVRLIMLALRYLNNPKDRIVEFELVDAYHSLNKKQDKQHDYFKNISVSQLPDVFLKHQHHLRNLPIYELVEVLIRLFELSNTGETPYIQSFQDQVLDYSKNYRPDIAAYLEWWEQSPDQSVQLSTRGQQMEILTLHKSKGLQYPIVIMPFCDFNMDARSGVTWYPSPDQPPFNELDILPMRYSGQLTETLLAQPYQEELSSWYLEHLNMLYVAFTRAETGLFVFAKDTTGSRSVNVSKLLLSYFKNEQLDGWDESTLIYSNGILPPVSSEKDAQAKSKELQLVHYPSYKWSDRLKIKKLRNDLLDEKAQQKVDEGILLHQILSEIKVWSEAEEVLLKYEKSMQITSEEREIYSLLFKKLWKDKVIKSWFDTGNEVKTEVLVLPKDGEYKRLDRVVLNGNFAKIIDFKSGKPKPEDKTQMKTYMKLLAEMGYETTGYLLYLSPIQYIEVKKKTAGK